jgi:hypothetical protein
MGEVDMVRLASIVLGLFLVIAYLAFADSLGVVSSLTEVITSALPADNYAFLEFFLQSTLQMIIFLVPALLFLTWGLAPFLRAANVDRAVAGGARHSLAIALVLAAIAALMAFGFATFVIQYHPITFGDEYCYTFQAKLLESGRFYAPPPPVAEPFRNRAFVLGERWYGIGFGGHPLFLVFGLWLNAIYLTPALWAAVSVFLTYALMRALCDRGTAVLAALMVALSPLFLLYHATLLPETSSLALGLAFLFLVALGLEKNRLWLFFPAAIVLAFELVTRPQSALMFGACAAAWLLLRPGRSAGAKAQALFILAIGGLAGILGLLGYAHLVSGDPFGAHLSPGYHHDELGGIRGLGLRNSREVAAAVGNLGVSTVKLNFMLLGWPVSWIPLGLWLLHGRKSRWEFALGATAMGFVACYFFYRARQEQYFMEAGYLLILLGAIGVARAYRSAKEGPGGRRPLGLLVALVLFSYALGALSVWPNRLDYFRQRTAPERTVLGVIERTDIHRAVVFLDSLPAAYEACVGRNSPNLDDDVILAKVKGAAEIAELSRHFPGRGLFRMVSASPGRSLRLVPYEGSTARNTGSIPSAAAMPAERPVTAP